MYVCVWFGCRVALLKTVLVLGLGFKIRVPVMVKIWS